MAANRTHRAGVCTVIVLLAGPLFAADSLEIVSPANGTVFRPGQTVTITVRANKRYAEVTLIPADPMEGIQSRLAEPYTFSIALPKDLDAGIYGFTVLGVGPGGIDLDSSTSANIDVEPIWSASADGSRLVRDSPGVTVDTFGIPLRHRSAISYPSDALARRIEGTVVIEMTLDWEGRPEGFDVISGPPELAKHVIRCLPAWHYTRRVGRTKPRRVSVTFNLAQGLGPTFSDGGSNPQLVDTVPYEFWVSMSSRSTLFYLKKLAVLGLSEDATHELMADFNAARIQEGNAITFDQLQRIGGVAVQFDHDLRTYRQREGSEISATIAPVGFIAGDTGEDPPIQTKRLRPGEAPPSRMDVSAAEQARRLISKVEPEYPFDAKLSHIQGVVKVRIVIAADGHVLNLQARGHPLLTAAAEDAVKQWVYSPAIVNGRAVEVYTEVEVEFWTK
jgi:TonB family protein